LISLMIGAGRPCAMDISYYALEVLAKDRLDRARVDAERRRLLRGVEGVLALPRR